MSSGVGTYMLGGLVGIIVGGDDLTSYSTMFNSTAGSFVLCAAHDSLGYLGEVISDHLRNHMYANLEPD